MVRGRRIFLTNVILSLSRDALKLYFNKMDVVGNDSEHLFLLPVALIFQNELGSSEQKDYDYNATTTGGTDAEVGRRVQTWKMDEITLSEQERLEKLGDVIRKELKWTFSLHTYGFGCLFFILAFYTFFSILNIRSFISSKPFMSTINGFLCLLGTSRAASLFINPYNLKENMPRLFGQVLWDLGFPSIISAFSLVQLAFLQFTQLQVGPEGLRRKSCLSLVVTAHFLLTIAMDIIVASHDNLTIVKHVIHYIFLTWGVFLCSSFLYNGYKIMSMIKSLPEGLKHKDLPDAGYKGIMQLAMLAPHNNAPSSMTSTLLPTLCTPKIHQQENANFSSVGFRSDGSSRILESESIPILEELIGSSGDEISPNPLVRAPSFQNQRRNSQKLNLKPKLYFKSILDDSRDDELSQRTRKGNSSEDRMDNSTKCTLVRTNESNNMNVKSSNMNLKSKKKIVSSQSDYEFKHKYELRTCFENENFCFANEKKRSQTFPKGDNGLVPKVPPPCSDECEVCAPTETVEEDGEDRMTLRRLMSEISKDLNEMQILRGNKSENPEEAVEVDKPSGIMYENERESSTEKKSDTAENNDGGTECTTAEKRNEFFGKPNQTCSDLSGPHTTTGVCDRSFIASSDFKEFTKFEGVSPSPDKRKNKRNLKFMLWKKKPKAEEEEATRECLLLQEQSTNEAVRSAMGRVACKHRGPKHASCDGDFEKIRKSKVEWVLNITYITAMWGLMLCLSYMGKIYSPFGLPELQRTIFRLNSTHSRDESVAESTDSRLPFSSWPWLWFQTFCRALELAMGCAMANITRQPSRRYSRVLTFRHGDTFYNI